MRVSFSIVAALTLLSGIAWAEAGDAAVQLSGLYAVAEPYLLALFGVLASALTGWIAAALRRKWRLEIDAYHRDALQTALTNAAGLALHRLGSAAAAASIDVRSPALAAAVNYAVASAPEAIARFGLGPELVAEKILAKLPQLQPQPRSGRAGPKGA